jgi:hypothetical protein
MWRDVKMRIVKTNGQFANPVRQPAIGVEVEPEGEDALTQLQSASICYRIAAGRSGVNHSGRPPE